MCRAVEAHRYGGPAVQNPEKYCMRTVRESEREEIEESESRIGENRGGLAKFGEIWRDTIWTKPVGTTLLHREITLEPP